MTAPVKRELLLVLKRQPKRSHCQHSWAKYGYFVGCNYLGDWPYPKFDTYYNHSIWYSLPGKCPSAVFSKTTPRCELDEPGGACSGTPTGAGNCTYSYEVDGEISLRELQGKLGYSFWSEPVNATWNAWRVAQAAFLFQSKYPSSPSDEEMAAPACNFNHNEFYR
jgi:hypothetical protein